MRKIRLTGREMSVVRALGFGTGATGKELLEVTSFEEQDLLELLFGMMNAGFVVTTPYLLDISLEQIQEVNFEVNPAYARQIRQTMIKKV